MTRFETNTIKSTDGRNLLRVVTIDGPVGVGKSSVARAVADELGFRHVNTGSIYRAVALKLSQESKTPEKEDSLAETIARSLHLDMADDGRVFLEGVDISDRIRTEKVSALVSVIASIKGVRESVVRMSRNLGSTRPSVLEGRDTGTVIFPDAAFKFYLDADVRERVNRRLNQLQQMGHQESFEEVYRNLKERDDRDKSREWGALKKAEDAILIDSTNLDQKQVVRQICQIVREKDQMLFSGDDQPVE